MSLFFTPIYISLFSLPFSRNLPLVFHWLSLYSASWIEKISSHSLLSCNSCNSPVFPCHFSSSLHKATYNGNAYSRPGNSSHRGQTWQALSFPASLFSINSRHHFANISKVSSIASAESVSNASMLPRPRRAGNLSISSSAKIHLYIALKILQVPRLREYSIGLIYPNDFLICSSLYHKIKYMPSVLTLRIYLPFALIYAFLPDSIHFCQYSKGFASL